MESFQRAQVDSLVKRLAEPPRYITALFGPRQTGKTTIARQVLGWTDLTPCYLQVDDSDEVHALTGGTRTTTHLSGEPKRRRWLVDRWKEARREAERSPRGAVLV